MKRKKNKRIITIIVLIMVILCALFVVKNISINKVEKNENAEYQEYTPQEEITEEQMRQTKVILFFENAETGELDTEIKMVDAKVLIENPYRELVNLLIKGPQSSSLKKLIPEGTAVHDVIVKNSCAEINLSKEFLEYGNDENKLKIINSIVNTLTNLKEVESVKFLINGEENEKFNEIYVKNK